MIGIIAAMDEEMNILLEELHCEEEIKKCGISFYVGNFEQKEIIIAKSGVGKVNAAMAATLLIDSFECDFIIHTGIAGGLCGVQTEDVIIGSRLVYADVDATVFGYARGQVPGMPAYFEPAVETIVFIKTILKKLKLDYVEATIYTSDSFISSLDQLKGISLNHPAIAEMEGAAVAQVCTRSNVPYIVLRYVSDVIGSPNQIEDYEKFESQMAKKSSQICLKIIQNLE